jgi:hypothetical protein
MGIDQDGIYLSLQTVAGNVVKVALRSEGFYIEGWWNDAVPNGQKG